MSAGSSVTSRALLRAAVRRVRRSRLNVLGTIDRVRTDRPVAALTFDDGPDPVYTPRVLEALERRGARATFFVVGRAARAHPELVRRLAEGGHAVANHSWDHPSFPEISGRERRAELRACAEAIAPYGEPLFRPPWGHQTLASRLDALALGYRVVAWTAQGRDWEPASAEVIAGRVLERLRPGAIVLLHDALYRPSDERARDRTPAIHAVERILDAAGDRFRFVTLPELLRTGRPIMRSWYISDAEAYRR